MAGRGRTTFQKRQKEQMRLERRQQKLARKIARKSEKEPSTEQEPSTETLEYQPPEPSSNQP